MYNTGKVIFGLIIFLLIATFPIWYAVAGGKTSELPELEKAAHGKTCVMETAKMRASHMNLLIDWREDAVRRDDRYYTAFDGSRYEKSLTRSCLGCHINKKAFCDRCHTYLAVVPYCWDCHVDPKEVK